MGKQTKNILTREVVRKNLQASQKKNFHFCLYMFGISLPFLLPAIVGVIYLVCSRWATLTLPQVLLCVFFVVLAIALICINPLCLLRNLKKKKMLQRGEFDIVTRELLYKSESMLSGYRVMARNSKMSKFLHFSGFAKKQVQEDLFQLTSQGDAFYIVHYKGKDFVELLYPLKMYEYKER